MDIFLDNRIKWVVSFTYEAMNHTAILVLTENPENSLPTQTIAFNNVGNITSDELDISDDGCLCDLIGFDQKQISDGRSKFTINTNNTEIILEADSNFVLS